MITSSKDKKAALLELMDVIRDKIDTTFVYGEPASRFGMRASNAIGELGEMYMCYVEVNVSCQKIPNSVEETERIKQITGKWPSGRGL